MNSKTLIFTIILMTLVSACAKDDGSIQYDCDFYEQVPAPDWVKNYGLYDTSVYEGVGMSHKSKNGFQDQVDSAYNAAVEKVAQSIETMVEISISHYVSVSDNKLSADEMKKLSKHYTKVLLKGIILQGQWVDQDSCTVWVRVTVEKSNIEAFISEQIKEKRALDTAEECAISSQHGYLSYGEKIDKILNAMQIIKGINFYVLTSSGLTESGYDYYFSKYANIRDLIVNTKFQSAEKLILDEAEKYAAEAQITYKSEEERLSSIAKAFETLKKVDFEVFKPEPRLVQESYSYYFSKYDRVRSLIINTAKQQPEKLILDEAEKYAAEAQITYKSEEERLSSIAKAFETLKKVDFEVFKPEPRLVQESYYYYYSKYDNTKKEILSEIKKIKERNNYLYNKAWDYLESAMANMNNHDKVESLINKAEDFIEEVNKNRKYIDGNMYDISEKLNEAQHALEREKAFNKYLRIGMTIQEAQQRFGSYEKEEASFFGGLIHQKYGKYWLIFQDYLLCCVVEEGYYPQVGFRNCETFRREKVRLFLD
ncbi:hypothetical protein C0583_00380 [Candidatus Parcubacteria bacterium]|nr:MAG: hypothetical protein C0583_00380 [Candidatus Parcubacteria bacterium]